MKKLTIIIMRKTSLLFICILLTACQTFKGSPGTLSDLLADFDRETVHEENPYGVPSNWSWARHSSDDQWTHLTPLYGETRTNFWIEVFPYDQPLYPENVKVAVKKHVYLALFEGDDTWQIIQKWEELDGAWYNYPYTQKLGAITDIEKEPDGSYSFGLIEGGNAHLWPTRNSPRIDFPGKLRAVIYVCQARLILDDPDGPDNRDKAKYIIGGGVDWKMPDGGGPPGLGYCDAIHHGKYIRLTNNWRLLIVSSMTKKERETFPLPPEKYFVITG